MSRASWIIIGALILLLATSLSAQTLSYVDLVNRLTDLESLAILPVQGETGAQWSSYDRASRYDAHADKYIGWDANWDGLGVIRKEGDDLVFAEMQGPGCIWRIWSALAKQGHVKIYLDDATEPVVDLPFDGYFNLQNPPFDYPGLVHDTAQGRNCYVPIPYQKSCKIVGQGDWGAYYEFNYTTFPKGTVVPTFTRNLGPKEKAALKKTSLFITRKLGTDPVTRENRTIIAPLIDLAAGETATVARIKGPNAITSLHAMINGRRYSDEQLRSVVLKIYWDNEKQPSVWSPIGDFFGTAPGLSEYKSLPMGVTARDAYSYWYMPFAKEAVVEITNEGREPFKSQLVITYAPLTKSIDQLGRFHAKWHRDAFLPTEKERSIDWTVLKTEGRGRFCGMALEIWNPRGGWWGEGDEKWFVDGEKFPSTFGTGSEDYFGYAWCDPNLFQNAYHNQTRNDNTNNTDHISVNRWQIAENIPFQKSFDGYIEKYFPNSRPTHYASTVYWYLAPGGVDPYTPVSLKERLNWYLRPIVKKKPGIWEGEDLKIISKSAGTAEPQMLGERFSEESHLWWIGARPGDTLTLALDVPKSGKYTLLLGLTKAIDYGIVQWSIDGKEIGEPMDLYNDGVIPFGPVELGVVDLKKGERKLTAAIIGANEKAIKQYMVGLDYVNLKAAE